jgi:hypothetical protein
LILFLFGSVYAQQKTAEPGVSAKTNTVLKPGVKRPGGNNQVNSVSAVQTETYGICLNKKFSIVFYIIQDSTNKYNSTSLANPLGISAQLTTIINILNQAFNPICVSFENCSTVVIPNFTFNKWKKPVTDTVVTTNWYTDNTINVYLPEEYDVPSGPDPGDIYSYSYLPVNNPASNKDVIIVHRLHATDSNNALFYGSHTLHAFGHYFGLRHTFDEINPGNATPPAPNGVTSKEYVNGTNSLINGDGIADTEADPYPTNYVQATFPFCYSRTLLKDVNGEPYVIPGSNMMSGTDCKCIFTPDQYVKMANTILTKRMYLH